jgi:WD40 repeat protein
MHDDKFLSQFQKAPRPEFAEKLRAKLTHEDYSEESKTMNRLISFPYAVKNADAVQTHSKPAHRRGYAVALVAVATLVIFFGAIVATNLQPKVVSLPGVPAPAASVTPLPTPVPSAATPQAALVDAFVYRAVWSPNGEVLALASSKGVWIYDANDLAVPLYNIYPRLAVTSPLVFSQDSKRLAFATGQGIRLWDLTKQEKIETNVAHEGFNSVFALNADGSILASAHHQGIIYFHNVDTNTTLSSVQAFDNFQPIVEMRFNAAGTKLLFMGSIPSMGANTPFFSLEDPTGMWRTYDQSPTLFSPSVLSQGIVQSIGYSAESSRLAARVNGLVVIWDMDTKTEVKRFDTRVEPDQALWPERSMFPVESLVMKSGTGDMTFNADGSQIATVDTSVRIWDVASGKARTVIGPTISNFEIAASKVFFKAGWTQLSVVDASGAVLIVDMASGEEVARIGGLQATDVTSASNPPFEYGGHVTSVDSDRAISAMQQAGMSWIKIEKHYGGVVTDDAADDIEAAHANGFKVLIGTVGSSRALLQRGDDYIASYTRWLGEIAAAGADAIEVWQEPNLDRTWPQGQIGGASYTIMLRAAYQAIKETNPNTLVISAAPAPTGAEAAFPGMVQNDYNWLQELVAAGGLGYLDCVGIHYNEGILPPDATSGDPRDSYHTRYFTSMMDTYKGVIDGKKPLCFTEIGYLSSEGYAPLPEMFTWADHVTAAQQGEWLAQAASIAAQSGQVRLMIVWNVDYTNYGDDPQAGYAIIRPDGRCPACDALAALR